MLRSTHWQETRQLYTWETCSQTHGREGKGMGQGASAALWGIQFKMADTAGTLNFLPSWDPVR